MESPVLMYPNQPYDDRGWINHPDGRPRMDPPSDGRCRGCYLHCKCRDCGGNKSIPPGVHDGYQIIKDCEIQRIHWVQLHMPDKIDNLTVALPSSYILRGDVGEKIDARYQLFPDHIIQQVISEINHEVPSMEDYNYQSEEIKEKYLIEVSHYGKYIFRDEKKKFEERVVRFKKMLEVISKRIREKLIEHLDEAVLELYDAFLPSWELTNRWWEFINMDCSDAAEKIDRAKKIFKDDMSRVALEEIKKFIPVIRYPYSELTIEQRIDPRFRKAAEIAFRTHLEKREKDLDWLLGVHVDDAQKFDRKTPA